MEKQLTLNKGRQYTKAEWRRWVPRARPVQGAIPVFNGFFFLLSVLRHDLLGAGMASDSYRDMDDLELLVFLPLPPQCCHYRHMPLT